LGFLGLRPFGRENPRLQELERLGFPWILSPESSIINGLRGIFAEKISRALLPARQNPRGRQPKILACGKGRLVMGQA
jgi:hypothetical protein